MKRPLCSVVPIVQFDDIESTYPRIPSRFFKFNDARLISIYGGFQLAIGPVTKPFYFHGGGNSEMTFVSGCGQHTITIEDN